MSIFIQKVKVTPSNQFRELQILWLFPARSSDTGTAGTGIEILGSCSAHPLNRVPISNQELIRAKELQYQGSSLWRRCSSLSTRSTTTRSFFQTSLLASLYGESSLPFLLKPPISYQLHLALLGGHYTLYIIYYTLSPCFNRLFIIPCGFGLKIDGKPCCWVSLVV